MIFTKSLRDLTPNDLDYKIKENPNIVLIDVRTLEEYRDGYIKGARLYPLGNEAKIAQDFSPDQELILVCRSGQRTKMAAEVLNSYKFKQLSHLQGGMEAWKQAHKPITKD